MASPVIFVSDHEKYRQIFLQAIREVLPQLKLHSDSMLETKISKAKLLDVSLEFNAFILNSIDKELTQNETMALAAQVLRCLERYLRRMHVPVTLKTLTENIPNLGEAVNQDFPGYAASKILRYTITPPKVQPSAG